MAAIPVVTGEVCLESQSTTTAAAPCKEQRAASKGGIFRKGGVLPTSLCLTKAAVGAGVLSMSVHAAKVGLLYTGVCLAAGGGLTIVSVRMLAEASLATGRWSFEDICEELFHPAMSFFTGFVNAGGCLGAASGYLIVCGQVFLIVTNSGEAWRKAFVTMVGVLVCVPLALAPHVAFMRHLAAVSVGSILLLVLVVAIHAAENGVDDSVTKDTFWYGEGGATIFAYMNSINTMVFAYNNQFNVPQLTGELTPQPDVAQMTIVGSISTTIAAVLYVAVSVAGVLAFGVRDQKDTLVLDLFPEGHQPLVLAANLAVMFSVITCFQFHMYPIRQFCAYGVRKARGRPADANQLTDCMFCGVSLTRWLDMACGVASVLVAVVIAVAITELTVILNFLGGFAGSWISFVVPPLFVLQIRRVGKGFSWWSAEVAGCVALFSLGVFFFVFGTYAAVVG